MSHAQSLLFELFLTSSAHSTRTSDPTPSLFLSHGDDHSRRSAIRCNFRPIGWTANACRSWAQRSHWHEQYRGDTDVLPQTEHDMDLWFSCEHCDSLSWIEFSRWAITAHAGFTTEREASADRSGVNHSYRENSVSSSSHFRAGAERPAAEFSHKRKSSQESNSGREGVSLAHRAVRGVNAHYPDSLNRKMLRHWPLKNIEIIYSQRPDLKYWRKNAEQIFRLFFSWISKTNLIQSYGDWP